MSMWTYVMGVIAVSPYGRSQEEKTYILKTVLNHLPKVTGSEHNMYADVIQKQGYCLWGSCDEYQHPNNDNIRIQDDYLIQVYGSLRDRDFETTFREFQKWLCRLSKRLFVDGVLVNINGCDTKTYKHKSYTLEDGFSDIGKFSAYYWMNETPSWTSDGKSHNWCEHLMWRKSPYDDCG